MTRFYRSTDILPAINKHCNMNPFSGILKHYSLSQIYFCLVLVNIFSGIYLNRISGFLGIECPNHKTNAIILLLIFAINNNLLIEHYFNILQTYIKEWILKYIYMCLMIMHRNRACCWGIYNWCSRPVTLLVRLSFVEAIVWLFTKINIRYVWLLFWY